MVCKNDCIQTSSNCCFYLLYLPCLATLGMLRSVIGTSGMIFSLFLNTAVGTAIALIARFAFWLFSP